MVQLIDTPPITADFLDPNLLGLIRGSDVALLMFDAGSDDGIDALARRFSIGSIKRKRGWPKNRISTKKTLACRSRKRFSSTTRSICPAPKSGSRCSKEFCPLDFREFRISAEHGTGLEELRRRDLQVARRRPRLYEAADEERSRLR